MKYFIALLALAALLIFVATGDSPKKQTGAPVTFGVPTSNGQGYTTYMWRNESERIEVQKGWDSVTREAWRLIDSSRAATRTTP